MSDLSPILIQTLQTLIGAQNATTAELAQELDVTDSAMRARLRRLETLNLVDCFRSEGTAASGSRALVSLEWSSELCEATIGALGLARLDLEQVDALLTYAKDGGSNWRALLRAEWRAGSTSGALTQVRNVYGPEWLSDVPLGILRSLREWLAPEDPKVARYSIAAPKVVTLPSPTSAGVDPATSGLQLLNCAQLGKSCLFVREGAEVVCQDCHRGP